MSNNRRRVAVTGMGIISCLGLNLDAVRKSLINLTPGIQLLPERKKLGFQSGLSGVISGFDPLSVLDRKRRKSLPEFGLWAWAAISQALEQADIEIAALAGDERCGLIFGNDSSAVTAVEQVDMLREYNETKSIGSGHIFRLLTSTITLNISTLLGIRGSSWTVSGACASGAMAIGQGAELVACGKQERVICGGAQEISWQSMCSFDTLGAFSQQEDDPASSSRPFDRDRDGLVPSGGAAAVILESYEAAKKRGADILGEILGYGNTSDGYHIVQPSGEGLDRAMRMALNDAGKAPADIDLVLAHATSTAAGDRAEAIALKNIFLQQGNDGPYITAVKGLTGHEFWMAGASQVVYGLLMANNQFISGNRNLIVADDAAKPLRFPRKTIKYTPCSILCNAAGFGGTNACLIIKPNPS